MSITASPGLNLRDVVDLWRAKAPGAAPGGPGLAWVADGRSALEGALRHLRGGAQAGCWLVPAYCCPALAQTFAASGIKFDYYPVDSSLNPVWGRLKLMLEQEPIAGLVFIHYFGFRTDWTQLKPLIQAKAIPVIEDCAHMPMPNPDAPDAMESDARVYSLRKWFPIPHGGALLLKGIEPGRRAQDLFSPQAPALIPQLMRACVFSLEDALGLGLRGWLLSFPSLERRVEAGDAIDHRYGLSMDMRIASFLGSRAPRPDEILGRQRFNYEALKRKLENIPSVLIWRPALSEGECPFTLPVLIDPARRDFVLKSCLRAGIIARVYWKSLPVPVMTQKRFEDSKSLSEKMLCLPIHYRLKAADLDKIYDVVSRAMRRVSSEGARA